MNHLQATFAPHDAAEVLATVKTLRARARKITANFKAITPPQGAGAHLQIAKRVIKNAETLAHCNPAKAGEYCWDARHHLNFCEF